MKCLPTPPIPDQVPEQGLEGLPPEMSPHPGRSSGGRSTPSACIPYVPAASFPSSLWVLETQTLPLSDGVAMAVLPHRFDSELSQAHEEAQREKLQREKLQREKDMLLAEAFSLKQQLEVRWAAHHPHPVPFAGPGRPRTSLSFSFAPGKRHGHCRVHTEGRLPGG